LNQNTTILTKADLASAYGVTNDTLRAWLRKCKFYDQFPKSINSKYLSPKEKQFLFDSLGEPSNNNQNNNNEKTTES